MAQFMNSVEERIGRVLARLFPQLFERHVAWAFPDGKVAAVSADGRFCDLYLNAADVIGGVNALTKDVPIAPGVTVAVGNEVIVLRRAPRDLIVMTKKVPNASA